MDHSNTPLEDTPVGKLVSQMTKKSERDQAQLRAGQLGIIIRDITTTIELREINAKIAKQVADVAGLKKDLAEKKAELLELNERFGFTDDNALACTSLLRRIGRWMGSLFR